MSVGRKLAAGGLRITAFLAVAAGIAVALAGEPSLYTPAVVGGIVLPFGAWTPPTLGLAIALPILFGAPVGYLVAATSLALVVGLERAGFVDLPFLLWGVTNDAPRLGLLGPLSAAIVALGVLLAQSARIPASVARDRARRGLPKVRPPTGAGAALAAGVVGLLLAGIAYAPIPRANGIVVALFAILVVAAAAIVIYFASRGGVSRHRAVSADGEAAATRD